MGVSDLEGVVVKLVKRCKDCAHYIEGGDCANSPARQSRYGEMLYRSAWWERGLLERMFFGTCGPLARNWKPKEAGR
jgi:hypothetical protein